MKILSKIFFISILLLAPFSINITNADDTALSTANLTTWTGSSWNWLVDKNNPLKSIKNSQTDFTIDTQKAGQQWLFDSILRIARDLKNLFFLIAWVYFVIIVLRLLFSEKSEEAVSNFKKWIIWISIWIIVTQIAYYIISILFDKNINVGLAQNFADIIIKPFISLLETSASFIFIAMMIYSFFRIVTSNWDEEKTKLWKMTVLYAIVWFIVIKLSSKLVDAIYSKVTCSSIGWVNCTNNIVVGWAAEIIVKIINWLNWFIWLVTIILIIYAWFMVLTSVWDEEKLKKAKNIIIYIAIWMFILAANYLILTFIINNVK